MGYDNNILEEKRHITDKDLDDIPGGCAIVVEHKSGHSEYSIRKPRKDLA